MSRNFNFTFSAEYASQLTLRKRRENEGQINIRTEDTLRKIFQEIRKATDTINNPCAVSFSLLFKENEIHFHEIVRELRSCGFSVELQSRDPNDLESKQTLVISWPDPDQLDKTEK